MPQKPEISQIWNIASVELKKNFTFAEIKELISLAGMDRIALSHLIQKQGEGSTSKSTLLSEIDGQLDQYRENEFEHFLSLLCGDMIEKKPSIEEEFSMYLQRVGWQIYDKKVIPIEVFDISVLGEIHEASHEDLIKAVCRFRDGDLSGAIASASAAVDSLTYKIYQQDGLGDPDKASFQEKCKKSIQHIGFYRDIKSLSDIGWEDSDIKLLNKNLEGALNQFALVMQKLRAKMSDVHGSRPVFKALVFDCIQYAQLLVRMMSKDIKNTD